MKKLTKSIKYLVSIFTFFYLILFFSLYFFQESFPIIPMKLAFRFPFENHKYLETNTNEILIIQGNKDSVIPFSHFGLLKEKFEKSKNFTFVEVPEGDHNDLSRFEVYQKTLDSFLK